jgi:hypothetical protein
MSTAERTEAHEMCEQRVRGRWNRTERGEAIVGTVKWWHMVFGRSTTMQLFYGDVCNVMYKE